MVIFYRSSPSLTYLPADVTVVLRTDSTYMYYSTMSP
jgi:hypothetical protein